MEIIIGLVCVLIIYVNKNGAVTFETQDKIYEIEKDDFEVNFTVEEVLSASRLRRINKIKKARIDIQETCWDDLDNQEDPARHPDWQCQPKQVLGRVILPKRIRDRISDVLTYKPVEMLVTRCAGACLHGYGFEQSCSPQNSSSIIKKDVSVRVHWKPDSGEYRKHGSTECVTGKVTHHQGDCACGCGQRVKKRCRDRGGTLTDQHGQCTCQ